MEVRIQCRECGVCCFCTATMCLCVPNIAMKVEKWTFINGNVFVEFDLPNNKSKEVKDDGEGQKASAKKNFTNEAYKTLKKIVLYALLTSDYFKLLPNFRMRNFSSFMKWAVDHKGNRCDAFLPLPISPALFLRVCAVCVCV